MRSRLSFGNGRVQHNYKALDFEELRQRRSLLRGVIAIFASDYDLLFELFSSLIRALSIHLLLKGHSCALPRLLGNE
jgi:hypothetical protein